MCYLLLSLIFRNVFGQYIYCFSLSIYVIFVITLTLFIIITEDRFIAYKVHRRSIVGLNWTKHTLFNLSYLNDSKSSSSNTNTNTVSYIVYIDFD